MEEKKIIKVRLSTVILCFIILLLIIGMVCMYFYFTYKDNTNVPTNTVQTSEVQNNTNSTEETISQLDINSSIVTKLYSYIPIWRVDLPEVLNAYQNKTTTIKDISEDYLLGHAFNQLNLSDKDKLQFEYDNGTLMEPDPKWFTFKTTLLQEKVKELYGTSIKNQDFECGIAESCVYKGEKYSHSQGGSWDRYKYGLRHINKAYEIDDTLYIEDKFITLVIDQLDQTNPTYKLYTSSNCTNFVENLENSLIKKLEEIQTDDALKEVAVKYENKMVSYKHIFKKNSDGSYYWYSTEPIQ